MIKLRHTKAGGTPLDEWSAHRRDLYLKNLTLATDRRAYPCGIRTRIPSKRRPYIEAIDRAAAEIGIVKKKQKKLQRTLREAAVACSKFYTGILLKKLQKYSSYQRKALDWAEIFELRATRLQVMCLTVTLPYSINWDHCQTQLQKSQNNILFTKCGIFQAAAAIVRLYRKKKYVTRFSHTDHN
jgi:hypothetical protein